MHFPEAAVASEHRPHLVHHSDLHLKLKVLILPLSAENVTRNANFNRLLDAATARPRRTRHQVLDRKSLKKRGEKKKWRVKG